MLKKAKGYCFDNTTHLEQRTQPSWKTFDGDLVLTGKWAKGVLVKLKWNKGKDMTGKDDPSLRLLTEEKFSFQRNISTLVSEHDITPCVTSNIDEPPLLCLNTGIYTFIFKNVPVRGVDNRRYITASFTVSCTGDFLPIQLICSGKTK